MTLIETGARATTWRGARATTRDCPYTRAGKRTPQQRLWAFKSMTSVMLCFASLSVSFGHEPAGSVTSTSADAPGASAPEAGANVAPASSLDAFQLNVPVEEESLLRCTVQVVADVADWQSTL